MRSDLAATDRTELIAQCEAVLHRHNTKRDAGVSSVSDEDAQTILKVGDDLTDLLRWERRYADAITLQDTLISLLPQQAQRYRLTAATLAIENEAVEQGLAQLEAETALMEPAEGKLLMASTLTWLQRLAAATVLLKELVADRLIDPVDRSAASYSLFQVLSIAGKLPEAVAAWKEAIALDDTYGSTLPEMVRAQIYWRDFEGASKSVAGDPSEIRRSFYTELIAAKTTPSVNRSAWNWVSGHDPSNLGEAHEEFAEAALRNISPELALAALMPLIEQHKLSRQRLFLAGLAWAQQRQVERALWAFDLAMRLAEIERPRRTRPGAGTLRIFDAETRIAYGEVPLDADIRAYLDHFFMPKAAQAYLHPELNATTAA